MRMSRLALAALAALALAQGTPAAAQERSAPNSIFAEGLGPGLLYSINIERVFADDFGLRAGFSYMSFTAGLSSSTGGTVSSASVGWFSVPVVATYLGLRSGNNILELGAGGIYTHASGSATGGGMLATRAGDVLWGTAVLGYRRQPLNGGFMFRVGVSALAGKGLGFDAKDPEKAGVVPWPYLSLGASF
ncbi:hypothetical protein [Anaeromyxobacter diazotrophicus]|uniref:Outer membrane protein beta-barrel domain-containing protein n=1 Tax=Anaeromyxobacter diazotrophicus TaxID=2590199 RepID=A0A7I9VKI0_9BACT|nr:hypothetical protein [Anaeromyxobacter diazotrophicus]GEJ56885.1 hypothetical protein AMYX_16260 [Anaeromyxobacter diazotrophicus]